MCVMVDRHEQNIEQLWEFYDGHEKMVLEALLQSLVGYPCDLTLSRLVRFRNADSLQQLCHPSLMSKLGAGGKTHVSPSSVSHSSTMPTHSRHPCWFFGAVHNSTGGWYFG
jgi:hypothetical protein